MSEALPRRGLLVPTVTTVVIVAVLLALGVWQLERRVDKLALIAALDERLGAAPVVLPPSGRWQELTPAKDEFRRVTLRRHIDPRDQAQVFASPLAVAEGRLRHRHMGVCAGKTCGRRDGCGQSRLRRRRGRTARSRSAASGRTGGPVALTGYIRFPEAPGWLTPHADRTKRLWFVRDHLAMAQALGWAEPQRLAPFYIDLEGPAPRRRYPETGAPAGQPEKRPPAVRGNLVPAGGRGPDRVRHLVAGAAAGLTGGSSLYAN